MIKGTKTKTIKNTQLTNTQRQKEKLYKKQFTNPYKLTKTEIHLNTQTQIQTIIQP